MAYDTDPRAGSLLAAGFLQDYERIEVIVM